MTMIIIIILIMMMMRMTMMMILITPEAIFDNTPRSPKPDKALFVFKESYTLDVQIVREN